MTPEQYWAYKAFIRDDAADEALRSSEVFMAYRQAELKREAEVKVINAREKECEKEVALKAFDDFEKKIAYSPELKDKFRKIKAHLDAHPEVVPKVDPNFVAGINMLNLEE